MHVPIFDLLDAATLAAVRAEVARMTFTDGASTAGWHARGIKNNLQATSDDGAALVREALTRSPLFQAAVIPARVRTPMFSRYTAGMGYGPHVDDALMGGAIPLRTDVAITVFLSDPADYDGGELVIETASGSRAYKMPAGQAIAYPATTLHRVAEITRGERNVALVWVQSVVREEWQREALFDLDTVRRRLFEAAGRKKTPEFDLLAKTYANLLRAWATL